MSTRILVVDSHFLAWRAAHTTGELSHNGEGTGVIFGFLREILSLQQKFATNQLVFCFDSPTKESAREIAFPDYRWKRKEQKKKATGEQKQLFGRVKKQICSLREELLPYLGFKNIFSAPGFEGDDVVASIVNSDNSNEIIVVSGDRDLYQLITNRVIVWNPKTDKQQKVITWNRFKTEMKCTPDQWIQVKAIAGCDTDSIPGVEGCGEMTAIKYLTKVHIPNKKVYFAIKNWVRSPQYLVNLDLVRIPYPGTPDFQIVSDSMNEKRFKKLVKRLGMKTLEGII